MWRSTAGLLMAFVIGASSWLGLPQQAEAAIISALGGTVTLDGQTGLEWLDMTASTGFGYQEIQAELLPGGQFEGFRLATRNEVRTLWENAGATTIANSGNSSTNYQPGNFPAINALQSLMGAPDAGFNVGLDSIMTYGLSADIIDVLGNDRVAMPGMGVDTAGTLGYATLSQYANPLDAGGSSTYGSWLVRDTNLPLVIPIGDGSQSLDLVTGNVWLDMTLSTGLSFQEIQAETAAGGLFESYRLATRAEVGELWEHAGIVDIAASGNSSVNYTAANFPGASYLQGLMGAPDAGFNVGFDSIMTYGLSADIIDVLGNDRVAMPGMGVDTAGTLGYATLSQYANPLDAGGSSTFGSWLVSDTPISGVFIDQDVVAVPEPSSLALFVIGVIGLGAFARRTRRFR